MAQDFGSLLGSWVQLVVPQPCFDEFFVEFNFFHAQCLKQVLSKVLGYAIIAGSVLVKVPQIMKIYNAKSGEGINMLSTTLELSAITGTLAYSYGQGFPFSAYGEAVFLLIQTIITATLVMVYTNRQMMAITFMTVYGAILSYLLSSLVSSDILWFGQASVLPNVVIARLLQATTNYRNGSTGQLSIVTFLLLFTGSLARIFTSTQETGDPTVIMIYVTSSCCNAIILSQIIYYGQKAQKQKTQ